MKWKTEKITCFCLPKIWQILKHYSRALIWAQTSYFWRVIIACLVLSFWVSFSDNYNRTSLFPLHQIYFFKFLNGNSLVKTKKIMSSSKMIYILIKKINYNFYKLIKVSWRGSLKKCNVSGKIFKCNFFLPLCLKKNLCIILWLSGDFFFFKA